MSTMNTETDLVIDPSDVKPVQEVKENRAVQALSDHIAQGLDIKPRVVDKSVSIHARPCWISAAWIQ
jgi:hypothetical protein